MTYPTKKLGEICDILDNLRKPVTKRDRKSGPYPYYGATGIQDYVNDFIFDEDLILVGEDGAKWDAGDNSAYKISGKSWVNNHAHVLRPHRDILLDNWLVYFLNISDLSEYITGTTVKKLNQEKLRSIPIPLPPIEIQKKIVEMIEKLMGKIDKAKKLRKEAMVDASSLIPSALNKIFEGGKKKGWEEKELREVIEQKTGKNTKNNLPYIGMEDIESNSGRFLGNLKPKSVKSLTTYFDDSCVLYGKLRPYLNKVFIPNFEGHCSTEFIPLKPNMNYLIREWLTYWIMSPDIVKKIMFTTTGARMPRANMKRVVVFKIPLPPLPEQQKIVKYLDSLSEKVRKIKTLQSATDRELKLLEKSVLKEAFDG